MVQPIGSKPPENSSGFKNLLDWWHVEAPGRDGVIQDVRKQKLSKVLGLVMDLIGKVRQTLGSRQQGLPWQSR